jgi:acetyltransferase-like isoleucine patch superfamily enzyme
MAWNESIKKELKYCGDSVFIGEHVIFTNPKEVVLHDRVRIDPFTLITTALEVQSNVQICSHTVLSGGATHKITLGTWTFIGYGSKLFCGSEDYSGDTGPVNEFWGKNKVYHGDIVFSDFSGIASNVIVMPGITLPMGCTIGANSFVYKGDKLTPWSVWLGNPLAHHKNRNREQILAAAASDVFLKIK